MNKLRVFMFIGAGIFFFASLANAESPRHAVVLKVKGTVEVKLKGQEWKPAQAGMMLYQEDEIRTEKKSTAKLLLDEKGSTGQLDLKPESRLRMGTLGLDSSNGDKTTILDLAVGKVLIHAEKLTGNSRFQVRTPNSTTGVRGTTFLVDAAAVDSEKD